MFNKKPLTTVLPVAALLILAVACSNNNSKKENNPAVNKDTVASTKNEVAPQRPPIINITDTVSEKRIIICAKDSAASFERIALKLQEIYGVKLPEAIKQGKLKATGQPMAWYNTNKAPFFFEAGIPVDKRSAKTGKHLFFKETGTDSITVAHFYGPYDKLPLAYEALKDYLEDRNKKAGKPYEIYVDDPFDEQGNPKDPYKVRTDIIMPWRR
ncbi:MAG TPA: hypothetical protein PKC39_13125 [Ferruginibacter sp.]|nr:hypothetical protein [Ferruginibacter sp.]HMP21895.1 hypothetical protein [Ferruginibacter sp.]